MSSLPSPDVHLEKFHEPDIFNYSVLLLSEDKTTLYVGAREAVFALSAHNISEKRHEVWRGLPLHRRAGHRPSGIFSSNLHWVPPHPRQRLTGPPRASDWAPSGVWPFLDHAACSPHGRPHSHPARLVSRLPPASRQGARHPEAAFPPCVLVASLLPGPATHPGTTVLSSWIFHLFIMENLQHTQE